MTCLTGPLIHDASDCPVCLSAQVEQLGVEVRRYQLGVEDTTRRVQSLQDRLVRAIETGLRFKCRAERAEQRVLELEALIALWGESAGLHAEQARVALASDAVSP